MRKSRLSSRKRRKPFSLLRSAAAMALKHKGGRRDDYRHCADQGYRADGAGIMECKRTLEEAGGDLDKAQALLIERAAEKAERKSDRATKHGLIDAYIHGDGRIGVLVEVYCETDFLSRSEPFRRLVRDLALQMLGIASLHQHRRCSSGSHTEGRKRGGEHRKGAGQARTRDREDQSRQGAQVSQPGMPAGTEVHQG